MTEQDADKALIQLDAARAGIAIVVTQVKLPARILKALVEADWALEEVSDAIALEVK